MRRALAVFVMLCAAGMPTAGQNALAAADKVASYSTDKKSVQYVVIDLAKEVGLGYNWEKSFAQTDPECRKFLFNVSINNQSFDKAMAKILGPVGLRYQVEGSEVVLYRR
jgi:hypothetical protein